MSTRRSFLVLTSGAALAGALPKPLFAQQAGSDVFSNRNLGAYAQGSLTKAAFESVVGSLFTLYFPDGSTGSLTLLDVKSPKVRATALSQAAAAAAAKAVSDLIAAPAHRPAPSCFFLTFSSGLQPVPQGSYQLDHGTLGSFAAFLVPGDPAHAPTCTACFNYL